MSTGITPAIQQRACGLSGSMRSLLASSLEYMEARWHLLRMEAGQATNAFIRAGVLSGIALFGAGSAYAAGMMALTLWIARHWWNGDLLPAALVVLGINIVVAMLSALLAARSLSRKTFFAHTIEELKTDRQCLNNPKH